jgi:hypothetical protein
MEDSIQEVVPDVAKIAGKLSNASVITARRRVRLVPQSGSRYQVTAGGGANTVNILIQDGQSYADLLSACLSFEVTTTATGGVCALDDGAYSVFRRALVSVNSTLMDDVDFLAKKANAELYATVSQGWYDNVGSMMGLWKANTSAFATNDVQTAGVAPIPGTNGFIDKYNVVDKLTVATGIYSVATAPNRHKYMVPVSLLSSFFRNETLFPLRNAGQLYLQLNLASAIEACVCPTGVSAPTYTIENLTMELDFLDCHPQFVSLLDEIMERPDSEGIRWSFDAHLVSAQNIAGGGGAGNGEQSVIVSKASQNMRSIQVVAQPTAGLGLATYPAQSTFCNPGFVNIQYRVGSLYFPAFPSLGEHRAFADLQQAFGRLASVDKSGIIDIQNYYNATKSDGSAMGAVYPYNGGLQSAGSLYQKYSDMWMHAYCFDKLKGATFAKGGVPDLDGINTLSSSGSQIVVQLNANIDSWSVAQPLTLTSILRFTRVLEIRGGATRVIG